MVTPLQATSIIGTQILIVLMVVCVTSTLTVTTGVSARTRTWTFIHSRFGFCHRGVEYGFMHTFAADQIVFLRGVVSMLGCRHQYHAVTMNFFHFSQLAGWDRRNPFWTRPSTTDTTFAWQSTSNPFAFPDVGTPSDLGNMSVSYPVSVTEALMLPLKGEIHPVPKKQRGAMKKRISAQLVNY